MAPDPSARRAEPHRIVLFIYRLDLLQFQPARDDRDWHWTADWLLGADDVRAFYGGRHAIARGVRTRAQSGELYRFQVSARKALRRHLGSRGITEHIACDWHVF